MIRFVRWTSIIVGGLLFAMVSAVAAEQAMPPGVLILDDSGGPAAGPFYPAIIAGLRGAVNRDPSKQYSIVTAQAAGDILGSRACRFGWTRESAFDSRIR
jgi:hypothetical protein